MCSTKGEIIRWTMHTAANKSNIAKSGMANLSETRDDVYLSRRDIDFFTLLDGFRSNFCFFLLSPLLVFLSCCQCLINLMCMIAVFSLQNPFPPRSIFNLSRFSRAIKH